MKAFSFIVRMLTIYLLLHGDVEMYIDILYKIALISSFLTLALPSQDLGVLQRFRNCHHILNKICPLQCWVSKRLELFANQGSFTSEFYPSWAEQFVFHVGLCLFFSKHHETKPLSLGCLCNSASSSLSSLQSLLITWSLTQELSGNISAQKKGFSPCSQRTSSGAKAATNTAAGRICLLPVSWEKHSHWIPQALVSFSVVLCQADNIHEQLLMESLGFF